MFFCRVTEGTVSGDFDDGLARSKEAIVPRVASIPGFAGQYWLADRDTGQVLAATFYDSREAMEASRSQAGQLRDAGAEAGGITIGSVREYEVVANTGDKVHSTAQAARAIRSKGNPEHLDQNIEMINNTVIPTARQFEGFEGGVWMADREAGEGLAITLYRTAEDRARADEQAAKLREQSKQQGQLDSVEATPFDVVARVETPAAVAG